MIFWTASEALPHDHKKRKWLKQPQTHLSNFSQKSPIFAVLRYSLYCDPHIFQVQVKISTIRLVYYLFICYEYAKKHFFIHWIILWIIDRYENYSEVVWINLSDVHLNKMQLYIIRVRALSYTVADTQWLTSIL